MDNRELINVLESLLGPAVAGSVSMPAARPRGGHPTSPPVGMGRATGAPASRATQPPAATGRATQPPMPAPVHQGSITALLSAEMPVGVAVLDAKTMRVSRTNGPLLSLLGEQLREEDVVGRPLGEVAPGLAGSEVEAAFVRVARTGKPFSAIIEEDHPGGPIYRRCSLSAIRRADGTYDDLLLTLLDVTEQMQARQRADYETQRADERATRVEEQALRASVRSEAVQALAHASDLSDALGRVAERTAESLGDCCAVFLLGEDDVLQLAALYHRDRVQGFRLRAQYAAHPLRRGEGLMGQVVLSGNGHLASHWGRDEQSQVAAAHGAMLDEEKIESWACVPLQEAARNFGALVLFSVRAANGGSGRALTGADLSFLQEMADQMAQAVQNVRLRDALRAAQAEKEVLLEASTDGVAIYDAQGRLRHLNAVGRQLLSRPVDEGMERGPQTGSAKRSFLAVSGERLEPDDLPWARALRGERIGEQALEPILVEWQDGPRRALAVRALPVADAGGDMLGAVVTLVDPTQRAQEAGEHEEQRAEGTPSGVAEWARWRETMELLDDGVVLCDAEGTAVFVNASGRDLLHLRGDDSVDEHQPAMEQVWRHLRRPDGSALPVQEAPAMRALAGVPVHDLETAVALDGGALRRIFWDARRIEGEQGESLGVVLIARAATEASPGAEAPQPVQPAAAPPPPPLAPTTLLPGRVVPEHAPEPGTASGACDLAEVCARVARGHGGVQGRRLEIRLPRRRVLVAADEALLESAVYALIGSGAAVMPATVPLHVAVWVERSQDNTQGGAGAAVPPGVGIEQINTVLIKPGQVPDLPAPTRLVAHAAGTGPQAAVAVVRVCSPGLGSRGAEAKSPMVEPPDFMRCRELVTSVAGRAWAREDPLLGPTYSFSVPLAEVK